MTLTDLTNAAIGHLETPRPQLDPITLTILMAIMTAVIEHYVEKCLDRLDHETVRAPGLIHRTQLWSMCLRAAHANGGNRKHANDAYAALTAYGKAMTEADLHAIKTSFGSGASTQ